MLVVGAIIGNLLNLYLFVFFLRVILSWLQVLMQQDFAPTGGLLVVFEFIYTVTDPPINFFERFLPPVRFGRVAISLGFMAAVLSVLILQRVNWAIFVG